MASGEVEFQPYASHSHVNGHASSSSYHPTPNGTGHSGNGDLHNLHIQVPLPRNHLHHLQAHDIESEGIRTPRPKNLTPSPPESPRTSLDGQPTQSRLSAEEGEAARLMRTVDFAARKHSCQRRKDVDQTPYINHPIAVANFLSSTGISDIRVLQAAILHDTVEDTHTTIDEIAENFGADVAVIVAECTDNVHLSGQARKDEQVRTAPFKSREAQQVKLADKLHNLESIRRSPPVGWGIRRIQHYFMWAKQVTDICAPSHPRLGARLQTLYETAYTVVNGEYLPCHPEVCGPLTEEEKSRIDKRLASLKKGEKLHPLPLYN